MTLATSTFILRSALALGLVLAACGDTDQEDATRDTEDAAQEEVQELTIEVEGSGKNASFSLPDTIRPRWTSLRLSSEGNATDIFRIFRLEDGATADEAGDALVRLFSSPVGTNKMAKAARNLRAKSTVYGGFQLSQTPPGETAEAPIVDFDPGIYAFFSFAQSRMIATVAVEGDEVVATPPEADVKIEMVDGAFQGPREITAGAHRLEVSNAGTDWHELGFGRLRKGTTKADVVELIRQEAAKGKWLPFGKVVAWEEGGLVAPIADGQTVSFNQEYSPGAYLMICGVRSTESGRPHYWDGHYSFIEVTD
jgi:hypothetical protein